MNTPSLEAIKRAHAALIDDLESLAAWARYRRVLKSELGRVEKAITVQVAQGSAQAQDGALCAEQESTV